MATENYNKKFENLSHDTVRENMNKNFSSLGKNQPIDPNDGDAVKANDGLYKAAMENTKHSLWKAKKEGYYMPDGEGGMTYIEIKNDPNDSGQP